MKNRRRFIDYVKDVTENLSKANYEPEKILEIANKLNDFNKVEYHFPRKGWKYLIDNFAPEIKRNENVYFTKLGDNRSAMSLKEKEGKYTVVFAFKHPKDKEDHDYKKYLVYKYILARNKSNNFTTGLLSEDIAKYRVYNGIEASSYKNSIVLANNKCLDSKYDKLQLVLMFNQDIEYKELKEKPNDTPEYYFKNCYENYKRIREQLMNEYDLTDKDIRFYYSPHIGILVIRNVDRYHVTFSFINPKDRYFLDQLKNFGDVKHIYRYCLIKNFLAGVHSYSIDNADNSMDAAVKMFNRHRFDFPSYYHDNKLDIVIKSEKDIIC